MIAVTRVSKPSELWVQRLDFRETAQWDLGGKTEIWGSENIASIVREAEEIALSN